VSTRTTRPASGRTRTWPLPDLRNGTTVHLVTDQHEGFRFFTPDRHARMGADLDLLKASAHAHVDAGDTIHWQTDDGTGVDPEDPTVNAWFAARATAEPGVPWVRVPGNHDLSSHTTPYPKRDATAWAAAAGQASPLTVTDAGDVRILGIGPDRWDYDQAGATFGTCLLSPATLAWLEAQLTAAGTRPVWIANHAPLWEQYAADTTPADFTAGAEWWTSPRDQLAQIIDAHPNVVGWLSGHVHANVDTRPAFARSMTVGARRIFAVNGPASGGRIEGVDFDHQQYDSPTQSLYVTYLGDAIDVRCRDHQAGQWHALAGQQVRHVLLTG